MKLKVTLEIPLKGLLRTIPNSPSFEYVALPTGSFLCLVCCSSIVGNRITFPKATALDLAVEIARLPISSIIAFKATARRTLCYMYTVKCMDMQGGFLITLYE